jgi:transcriptional regulator
MEKIDKKDVGARIRAIRLDRGMTMVEFGELLSAPQGAVSNWERGENLPNKHRLKKIASIANISVQVLLHGMKRFMYGIEWWNGKRPHESEQKPLPKVFTSKEAANDWLISRGYYKSFVKNLSECFDYTRDVPVSHLNEWPDEEYARIFKMEVVE